MSSVLNYIELPNKLYHIKSVAEVNMAIGMIQAEARQVAVDLNVSQNVI